MADTSWDIFADQEANIPAEDMAVWKGDVFSSGDAASEYAFAPAPEALTSFLNTDNPTYQDGLLAQTNTNYGLTDNTADQPAGLTVEGMIAGQGMGMEAKSPSMTEKVGEGMSTLHKLFSTILGEKGAQAMYGSAIAAGATALLQSLTGANKQIDYAALQDDRQSHEKELLTTKYAREDAERERKNKIAPRTSRINYKPSATAGYKSPGQASGTMYGLLGSKG